METSRRIRLYQPRHFDHLDRISVAMTLRTQCNADVSISLSADIIGYLNHPQTFQCLSTKAVGILQEVRAGNGGNGWKHSGQVGCYRTAVH
jgi:hypothetical protein